MRAASLDVSADAPGTTISRWRRLRPAFLPVLGLVGLLVAWELAVLMLAVPAFVLAPPSVIWQRFASDPTYILGHAAFTATASLAGFALALIVGGILAMFLAYSRLLERALYPYLVISKVVPIVAVAPVLAIWFGFGINAKIVIAFLIAFFPIVVNLVLGFRSPDQGMLVLMRSMNASEWQTFRKIRFPNAPPLLFAACRVAAPTTVIGAIVAEFVGSDQGLGYVITTAKGYLQTDLIFLAVIASSLLGIVLFSVVVFIESRVLAWHESQT